MSLNSALLQERFDDILQSIERLEPLRQMSREAFLADQDARDLASYRLLVAIEAALQICFHVSAQRLRRAPESYADCFSVLGEAGLIPLPLSEKLQRMARFRNLLIHAYWNIDYGQVYDLLQGPTDDLRQFVRAIALLL